MESEIGRWALKRAGGLASLLLTGIGVACNPHGVQIPDEERPSRELRGLSECGVDGNQSLSLEMGQPVTVLVHGCNSSAAKFGTLADVFALYGQKAICFSYDYRDSMESSALELERSLLALESQFRPSDVTVIAHSQGGLVARAALRQDDSSRSGSRVSSLVTVSTPFAGIESSSHCGLMALHVLSLGITVGVCQAIAGRKWTEIYPGSPFIDEPGPLGNAVNSHLMVVTDEQGACLRMERGKCAETDFVFSLEEQEAAQVMDSRTTNHRVRAGHTEIVGEQGLPPHKLIQILQQHGVLNDSSSLDQEELSRRLSVLY